MSSKPKQKTYRKDINYICQLMLIEVPVFVMNLPLSQHAHGLIILHKDGNISQFWRAILLSLLEPLPKKAFLQNKHLDNTFLMWRLRCLKVGL